jgi:predicted Zn-dependent peptidase
MLHNSYQKTTLANGLIVVTETIPHIHSVSIGVWIRSGSRQETKDNKGIAHFLEHIMFKGTKKRSAREIARSLESVGGYLNAFTSKEQTCYYAEVLDSQLPRAVDILSDMLGNSLFSLKEIEKEREVILDEIDSVEDTPDDLVQDIFVEKLYPENSLGYPILGTKETIRALNREQLFSFYRRHYTPENMVIAAAGNLKHEKLVKLCERKFQLPHSIIPEPTAAASLTGEGEFLYRRQINQTHICLGTTALPYNHSCKYELLLLNTLLGVGMGSRLFQNIREKHGVTYSIYSYVDFFRDNGLLAIYLGTEKNKKDQALRLVEKEIMQLKTKKISQTELNRVKTQLKGSLVLGLENSSKRMSRLAKMEIYLHKYHDVERVIKDIDKVTTNSLYELINRIFNSHQLLRVIFLPG